MPIHRTSKINEHDAPEKSNVENDLTIVSAASGNKRTADEVYEGMSPVSAAKSNAIEEVPSELALWILMQEASSPLDLLIEAITRRRMDVIQHLLNLPVGQRPDAKALNKDRLNPLHVAAMFGNLEVVQYLLALPPDQRPDIDVGRHIGHTPLHLAVLNKHINVMRYLLELPDGQRADANAAGIAGTTLFHSAVITGKIEILQYLMGLPPERRPDINAGDLRGTTPLHDALRIGYRDVVRFFLALPEDQRPDINAINRVGETPIIIAFESGFHDLVAQLQALGAQLPEHLRPLPAEAALDPDIGGNQSIHATSVHISVSESVSRLLEKYRDRDLDAAKDALFEFVNGLICTDELTDQIRAAKVALTNYGVRDFTDPCSGVTLKQLFGLVWLGIHYPYAANDGTQPTIDENMLKERKQILIRELYRMQRGYNITKSERDDRRSDKPICSAGGFTTLLNTLGEGRHEDVNIIFVNSKTLLLKANALIKDFINSIKPEDKQRYAQQTMVGDSILPDELLQQLSTCIIAKLEEEFGSLKYLLPNYDTIVGEYISALEFNNSVSELSNELKAYHNPPLLFSSSAAAAAAASSSAENGEMDVDALQTARVQHFSK